MARHTRGHGGAVNAKKRRSHKKSRNGCAECKQRHIRCDERQPICVNCETTERACSFSLLSQWTMTQKHRQGLGQSGAERSGAAPQPVIEQMPASNITSHGLAMQQDKSPRSRRSLQSPYDYPNVRSSTKTPQAAPDPYQIPSSASPLLLGDVRAPQDSAYPGLLSVSAATLPTQAIYTPQHMILLHHARAVPNLTAHNRSVVDVAIQHAIDAPYLLDEILAYAALHMAHMYPGSADSLRHMATELQSRGLTRFRRVSELVPQNDKSSAVPRFLLASLLGHHVLVETLVYCRLDLHFFIERFVEGLSINRGVMSVTPPAKDFLCDSVMQPFLQVVVDAAQKVSIAGTECDPLYQLMDESDLGETSVEACRRVIKTLQFSFDLCRHLDVADYPQSVSAFVVKVDASFATLLSKHVSEAVVILAFFGVLLHRCRHFWDFGDAGASLIRVISDFVSGYWREALHWPLHVLETEPSSPPDADAATS